MYIIGHRGAAGLAPENTIASLEAAIKHNVDMIEFDLRVTKDERLVLVHDPNLLRTSGKNKTVSDLTFDEIRAMKTKTGDQIASLDEAMAVCGDTPLLLDCKGRGWARALVRELEQYPHKNIAVTAIDTREMFRFKEQRPDIDTYVSELTKPFEAIYKAKLLGFTGISLNFWVMNPVVYFYAKRNGYKFIIFTINHKIFARFMHLVYPSAGIVTNVPNKLKHR